MEIPLSDLVMVAKLESINNYRPFIALHTPTLKVCVSLLHIL